MSTHLLCHGDQVLCVTADAVSAHHFCSSSGRFILDITFPLGAGSSSSSINRELVAAATVADTGAGTRAPAVALRTTTHDSTTYSVGVLDLSAQRFVCLRSVTVAHDSVNCARVHRHILGDGPTLWVTAPAEDGRQAATSSDSASPHVLLAICAADCDEEEPDGGDGGDGADGKRRRGSAASATSAPLPIAAQLAGRPTLLCSMPWSEDDIDDNDDEEEDQGLHAMLLLQPTEPGADAESAAAAVASVRPVASAASHSLTPASSSSPPSSKQQFPALMAADARMPALATLAGAITCAAARRVVGVAGASRLPRLLTRVWVGTTACEVHCCGCDGETAPLSTVRTPRVPLRAEPLPLQHGSDGAILAVLLGGGSSSSGGGSGSGGSGDGPAEQLVLLNGVGDVVRSFEQVSAWLCADFLGLGYPQLLVGSGASGIACAALEHAAQAARAACAAGPAAAAAAAPAAPAACGSASLRGYTLAGLASTFADVPLSAPPLPPGGAAQATEEVAGGRASAAHKAAVSRRRQLLSVAAALSDRLGLGYEAIDHTRRQTAERALIAAHAQRRLLAQAEGAATAPRPDADTLLLAQWKSMAQLEPVPLGAADLLARPGRSAAAAAATGVVGSAPLQPPPVAAAPAPTSTHILPVAAVSLRLLRLEHGFRQGVWLLRATVCNGGERGCHRLSAAVIHPRVALHAHSSVAAVLRPGEACTLQLAVPMASVVGAARALDLDLLLTWRVRPSDAQPLPAEPRPGVAEMAAPPEVTADAWRHCVASRVRLDAGSLFESALTPRLGVPSTIPMPPALVRSVSLCLEAPAGSRILPELPQTMLGALGLRPVDVDAADNLEGSRRTPVGAPFGLGGVSGATAVEAQRLQLLATPFASRRSLYRSSASGGAPCLGDGGGGATQLEVAVGGTGRCAELVLTASGPSHDAMLLGAISALRARLPAHARLEVSYASHQALDCLRRASLAMHAELMGTQRAVEDSLATTDGSGSAGAAVALPQRMGALQSATDAHMSVLHELLGSPVGIAA